jgi:hypothetical protein
MIPPLSFITLLSFDYRYAFDAISSYYAIADQIILGLDQSRLTWARQPFEINLDEIQTFIRRIDAAGKIRLVEGDFHAHDHPMENDTQERNALSFQCAPGHLIVQIDADEILLNAAEFVAWLDGAGNTLDGAAIGATWISVFKRFGPQALVIYPASEVVPIATRSPGQFVGARWTNERLIVSPLKLLHYSWGRSPDELKQKLRNWSHARDFDTDAFYQKWEGLTLDNYQQWHNFHPLDGPPLAWSVARAVSRQEGAIMILYAKNSRGLGVFAVNDSRPIPGMRNHPTKKVKLVQTDPLPAFEASCWPRC